MKTCKYRLGMWRAPISAALACAFLALVLAWYTFAGFTPGLAQTTATHLVTHGGDSGPGSLRQALLNADTGDVIQFETHVFTTTTGAYTITLSSPLPALTDGTVTLDASNAVVVIDGSALTGDADGITIASTGNTVQGLELRGFPRHGIYLTSTANGNTIGGSVLIGTPPTGQGNVLAGNGDAGIFVDGSSDNVILGNRIGSDGTGFVAGPGNARGIVLQAGAQRNSIGGAGPEQRNIISGNTGHGIVLTGSGTTANTIGGNIIGATITADAALPNGGDGVHVANGASTNEIGRDEGGGANLISGNLGNGVVITGTGTISNTVEHNVIGPDASGAVAIGNGTLSTQTGAGVLVGNGAQYNVIGGNGLGKRNLISGNVFAGVLIAGSETMSNSVKANFIGIDRSGELPLGNGTATGGWGVIIEAGASYNIIGGGTPDRRNIISGNGSCQGSNAAGGGILLRGGATLNHALGNYIGTQSRSEEAIANAWAGVAIESPGNLVGSLIAGQGNLISGNGCAGALSYGVYITGDDTRFLNNQVGVMAGGRKALPNAGTGIYIAGNAVRVDDNLVSGNAGAGLLIEGDRTEVMGNQIGTDGSGRAPLPNEVGILLLAGADDTIIGGENATPGGSCTEGCNLISGNLNDGIRIEGTALPPANTILTSNYIGTDSFGNVALPNGQSGIKLLASTNTIIGGNSTRLRNLISGNGSHGIWLSGSTVISTTIQGNVIGSNTNTSLPLPNGGSGTGWGIRIDGSTTQSFIGGVNAAGANTIAFNQSGGVLVSGVETLHHTLSRNHIYAHPGPGILLESGGNGELASPVFTMLTTDGEATGTACPDCTIQLFSDNDDEGRLFEGETKADHTGVFSVTLVVGFTGPQVTATASEPSGPGNRGATSAFSAPVWPPTLALVLPPIGPNDAPVELDLIGAGFQDGATVSLIPGVVSLPVVFIDTTHLRTTIPSGLLPDTYNLEVHNPDGGTTTLNDAYTAFNASDAVDDLYAADHDFWNLPITIREGDSVNLGLVVHRLRGARDLTDVEVDFYQGNPASAANLIGTGFVASLPPDGWGTTTTVTWQPIGKGDRTLYAVIDPASAVTETIPPLAIAENNNVISRTLRIVPRVADSIPPTVATLAVSTPLVTQPSALLTLDASDSPGGSGLKSAHFVEFTFDSATRQWLPVQSSLWLSATATLTRPVLPVAGVHYLHAWAADAAGNVSPAPGVTLVNYFPAYDTLVLDQVRIYRYKLAAGETLSVTVMPTSGDPDLYIWPPGGGTSWVSTNAIGEDHVTLVAPTSGTYQIEVHAYTAAVYSISMVSSATTGQEKTAQNRQIMLAKELRTDPVIAPGAAPQIQLALPPAPRTTQEHRQYLPLVIRQ